MRLEGSGEDGTLQPVRCRLCLDHVEEVFIGPYKLSAFCDHRGGCPGATQGNVNTRATPLTWRTYADRGRYVNVT